MNGGRPNPEGCGPPVPLDLASGYSNGLPTMAAPFQSGFTPGAGAGEENPPLGRHLRPPPGTSCSPSELNQPPGRRLSPPPGTCCSPSEENQPPGRSRPPPPGTFRSPCVAGPAHNRPGGHPQRGSPRGSRRGHRAASPSAASPAHNRPGGHPQRGSPRGSRRGHRAASPSAASPAHNRPGGHPQRRSPRGWRRGGRESSPGAATGPEDARRAERAPERQAREPRRSAEAESRGGTATQAASAERGSAKAPDSRARFLPATRGAIFSHIPSPSDVLVRPGIALANPNRTRRTAPPVHPASPSTT
jgi:hypothetical protein